MKKLLLVVLLVFTSVAFGQFKKDLESSIFIKEGVLNENPSGFLLDFLSIDDFSMNHTFQMSYTAGAGQGIALGVYTNSMAFKFSDKLHLEVDASVVNSPYNTIGKEFSNQINGVYLSRAALKYKISDNASLHIQYNHIPNGFSRYNYGYSPYTRAFRYDPFFEY